MMSLTAETLWNGGASSPLSLPPMPEPNRMRIRETRDQNVHTILTKEAIGLVNGREGIHEILNPLNLPIQDINCQRERGRIEQIWELVRAVETGLHFKSKEEILELATSVRESCLTTHTEESLVAVHGLSLFTQALQQSLKECFEDIFPFTSAEIVESPLSETDQEVVIERLLKLCWLEKSLGLLPECLSDSRPYLLDYHLSKTVRDTLHLPVQVLLNLLDDRYELLSDLISCSHLDCFAPLNIRKLPHTFFSGPNPGEEIDRDDSLWQYLIELDSEIERGELSAIDGPSYAQMRYTKAALDSGVVGETEWIFYEGHDHERAIEYARRLIGRDLLDSDRGVPVNDQPLIGVYGSSHKSRLDFRNGRSAIVVSYTGEGRLLSNAASILWYRDESGKRIDLKNIHLARDRVPLRERLERDFHQVINAHARESAFTTIHGLPTGNPHLLPTFLCIAQHPRELERAFGTTVSLSSYFSETLGTVYVGYWRNPSGRLTRLIVPSVGSSSLYRETAGMFLDIFAESVSHPLPHVVMTGTAGGHPGTSRDSLESSLARPGLPDVKPGAYIAPYGEIVTGERTNSMLTLPEYSKDLCHPSVRESLKSVWDSFDYAGVHRTWSHGCFPAPAFETIEKIMGLVQRGISSEDVESDSLNCAAQKHGFTFTPVYYMSDDPRDALKNPMDTLAWGGPLAEMPVGLEKLYAAVRSLMMIAHYVEEAREPLLQTAV